MALPGLRGTEHIGFTVPNLDEAERFFVDVIGCEKVYSLGPFVRDDNWLAEQLHVHPRAVMRELRFFRCRQAIASSQGNSLATSDALASVFEAALSRPELADLDWAALAEVARSAPETPTTA